MERNEVLWETVDYGEAAFHVVSYRREDAEVEPEPAVEEAPVDPCPIANLLFRRWVAGRSARAC